MAVYVGVDPGTLGGIAAISEDGTQAQAWKMPETRRELLHLLEPLEILEACVEEVGATPQMGVVSAFTFGQNYERPIMALMALDVRVIEVRPQKWQKELGLLSPPSRMRRSRKGEEPLTPEDMLANKHIRADEKSAHKKQLKERAEMLFPKIKITLYNCDALLLAWYGRHNAAIRKIGGA